jgi:glycosyltransferase involved in cell wall biosynthesis
VVDDSSTDNTSEISTSLGVHYIRLPFAPGPAAARNRGVQETAGEILVFVDSDVVVRPDALQLIAEDFASDPDLAAVFGSYEDIALGHRLYLAGRKILLDKRLQAKHLKRWTIR